jgi:hypothetical protein
MFEINCGLPWDNDKGTKEIVSLQSTANIIHIHSQNNSPGWYLFLLAKE